MVKNKRPKKSDPLDAAVGYFYDDEVPYFAATGKLFPSVLAADLSDTKITVQDTETGEWKVLPAANAKTNPTWETPDTEWIAKSLQDSFLTSTSISAQQYFSQHYLYGQFNSHIQQHVTNAREEQAALEKLFPCLRTTFYHGECPGGCSYRLRRIATNANVVQNQGCACVDCQNSDACDPETDVGFSVISWIVHLNDYHRWPRTQGDLDGLRRKYPEGVFSDRTIVGWLRECVEKYGWDLSTAAGGGP